MPSPVATSGLVVSLKMRPSPPVASRTAREKIRTCRRCSRSHATAPVTSPSLTRRSVIEAKLRNSMFPMDAAL